MKQVLMEIMTIFFVIIYMFQPSLNENHSRRSYAVEMILDAGIEKAASGKTGRFTPEIINEMKDLLVNNIGYNRDDIVFTGTTTVTERGRMIEGTLKVPHKQLWILPDFFSKDEYDKYIVKHASQMSEYLIR